MTHPWTQDDTKKENYVTSTTIPHTRTRHVGIFTTRNIQARTLLRGRYYAPIENFKHPETENATVTHPWTRNDAIEENYMISTTILHTRTFHVEICSTRETPARTFKRRRGYAAVEDFQDLETYWKRDCGTSLNVRPCNERKLHDIDNDLTSTHFSSRNVLDAWDNREDI